MFDTESLTSYTYYESANIFGNSFEDDSLKNSSTKNLKSEKKKNKLSKNIDKLLRLLLKV